MQRHLSAFESELAAVAGARLLSLLTAAGCLAVPPYQVACGLTFRAHSLDVQVQDERGMIEPSNDGVGLGAGIDEVGLRRRQRLQAKLDTRVRDSRRGLLERVHGKIDGLLPA